MSAKYNRMDSFCQHTRGYTTFISNILVSEWDHCVIFPIYDMNLILSVHLSLFISLSAISNQLFNLTATVDVGRKWSVLFSSEHAVLLVASS